DVGELAGGFGVVERLRPGGELLCEGDRGAGGVVELDFAHALLHRLDQATRSVGILDGELLLASGADDHQVAALAEQLARALRYRAEVDRGADQHRIAALCRYQGRRSVGGGEHDRLDRKSTRLNSSHQISSYA